MSVWHGQNLYNVTNHLLLGEPLLDACSLCVPNWACIIMYLHSPVQNVNAGFFFFFFFF